MANKKLAFQDIILTLQGFWSKQGANLMQAYDNEVGAGTMSPYTFLRSNGPEPWEPPMCNLHVVLLTVVMVKTQIGCSNTTNSKLY